MTDPSTRFTLYQKKAGNDLWNERPPACTAYTEYILGSLARPGPGRDKTEQPSDNGLRFTRRKQTMNFSIKPPDDGDHYLGPPGGNLKNEEEQQRPGMSDPSDPGDKTDSNPSD